MAVKLPPRVFTIMSTGMTQSNSALSLTHAILRIINHSRTYSNPLNNMRKVSLLFAALLSLWGGTIKAETLTDDFTSYTATSSGQTLGDNWYVFPGDDGNYGRFGSDYTYKNNAYDGADYNYVSGYSSNYNKNVWLVLKKQVSGDVTFRSKMGKNSGTLYVTNKVTAVGDGTFTVDKTGAQSYSVSTTAAANTFNAGATATYVAFCLTSDQMRLLDVTYTEFVQTSGPGLAVFGDDNGTLNFGTVNPGATKELTLTNPGTEAITVEITTEGGFTSNPTSATIAAGESQTLTIIAPDATATGKLTITPNPSIEGIAPVEITLSCVVKDPSKMYVDFADNALPEDWTTSGSWTFSNGYASCVRNSSLSLTTALMVFAADETITFDAAGSNDWEPGYGSSYAGSITVQASADGTSFSDVETFSGMKYNDWKPYSVTIPAGTKKVRFVASNASIDNIYGGKVDTTPRPKLEVEGIANGGSLSWGYSDMPAGSTKTITLKNTGTADLDVAIATTDDYTVSAATATIKAGESLVLTIGTPAHDGNGVLTITPAEASGLALYTISLSSYYKEPKPVMGIDKTTVAFGRVNEVKAETITLSNTGDADLVVTIENDNTTNFMVSAESVTVAPGETGTFTITYNFEDGTWGTFTANVKVTPNYGSQFDAKTITVSATSKNPNVWSEDFEEGVMPAYWASQGVWAVGTPTASGNNGTKMLAISSYQAPKTIVTPRLIATKDETLTFYIGMQYDDEPLTIEYSNDDQATWNKIEEGVEDYTASGDITFTAPADGKYYLRFTGTYAMLDNFEGFNLDLPDHIMAITTSNIPSSSQSNPMKQGVSFRATVTVQESRGVEEEVTAKFYMGDEVIGTATATVAANETKQITIVCTPTVAATEGAQMHIEVEYAGGTLKTDNVDRYVADLDVLALNENEDNTTLLPESSNKTYDRVTLKYTGKSGWNTVALPFAINDLSIFGEGVKAYNYGGINESGYLTFSTTATLLRNTPYVLYIETPGASDIVIDNIEVWSGEADNNKSTWNFVGTYAPKAAGSLTGRYGVTSEGKIQKAGANATMKAFRAYFEPNLNYDVKGIVFMEGETVVRTLNADSREAQQIFDLMGRRQDNAQKGISIVNGKKVFVK